MKTLSYNESVFAARSYLLGLLKAKYPGENVILDPNEFNDLVALQRAIEKLEKD